MTHTSPASRPTSSRYLEVGSLPRAELESMMRTGRPPEPSALAGFEFAGMNTPFWASWFGIRKFIKGFFTCGPDLYGYNCPVVQDGLDAPWVARPSDDAPRRFGFYRVERVERPVPGTFAAGVLLLDYGRGGNGWYDPVGGLRDYVVRVEPQSDDLLLGKAYYAVGPMWIPVSYFVLERYRPGPDRVPFTAPSR